MIELALVGLALAMPPSSGLETTVFGGYAGMDDTQGVDFARLGVFGANTTYRDPRFGFTVSTELSGATGYWEDRWRPVYTNPWSFNGALRGGIHTPYAGLEVGLLWLRSARYRGILPSMTLWAGYDGVVHVWGELNTGDRVGDPYIGLAAAGLGTRNDVVRAEVGVMSTAMASPGVLLRGEGRARDGVWLGGRLRGVPAEQDGLADVRVEATVTLQPLLLAGVVEAEP